MPTVAATSTSSHTPNGPLLASTAIRDLDAVGERRSFAKGDELFAEGDLADFYYKILYGTVRSSKLLSDARRQIDSFHLVGDIFGYETAGTYGYSADALEDTRVIAFRRSSFRGLMNDHPAVADQVASATIASLQRARVHMLLLARKTPQEKVAMFLLDIASRLQNGDRLALPMHRADIADHLGLTKETISRTLTRMAKDGLIKLESIGRTILLNDRVGLGRLVA